MARFAGDCLVKISKVFHCLEVTLGPGSSKLKRIITLRLTLSLQTMFCFGALHWLDSSLTDNSMLGVKRTFRGSEHILIALLRSLLFYGRCSEIQSINLDWRRRNKEENHPFRAKIHCELYLIKLKKSSSRIFNCCGITSCTLYGQLEVLRGQGQDRTS